MARTITLNRLDIQSVTLQEGVDGGLCLYAEWVVSGNGESIRRSRSVDLTPTEETQARSFIAGVKARVMTQEGI